MYSMGGTIPMADQQPQSSHNNPGLIEYALITALVAVLVLGIIIVLIPTITSVVSTLRGN